MKPGSDRQRVVDCHAHAVPRALLQLVSGADGRHGVTAREVDTGWLFQLPGEDERLVRRRMFDTELRAAWREEQGVDFQVMSPWLDLQPSAAMDASTARPWARCINEALLDEASASGSAPALATVALDDPEDAAADLTAAVRDDGMSGLMLSTDPVHCHDLADRRLDPLWTAATELSVPVMLHPSSGGPARALPDSEKFGNAYCRLVDTTFAVARLILSGVLDRHPGLRLLTVHGGGFLPYQGLRLDGAHRADALKSYELERGTPSAYFGDLYYDTVAMAAPAIRFLVDTVGAKQVLLGSDYPFPLGDPTPVASVRAAGLVDDDETAVLGANADELILRSNHG